MSPFSAIPIHTLIAHFGTVEQCQNAVEYDRRFKNTVNYSTVADQ